MRKKFTITEPSAGAGANDQAVVAIAAPDRLQHSIILYSSLTVLVIMFAVIVSLVVAGQYNLNLGTIIDSLTVAALCSAAYLASKRRQLLLQGLLLCISVPANLLAMLLMDDQGIFLALQLLSITPIIWGLFTTPLMSILYTGCVVAFINWYVGPAARLDVIVNGANDTFLTGVSLSLIAVGCGIAAVLPKHLGRQVYDALKRRVQRENLNLNRSMAYAELSSDWHLEVDEAGKIIHFFGKGDATGRHWRDVLIGWDAEETALNQTIMERQPFSKVKAILRLGGEQYRVEFSGRPQFNKHGVFRGYIGIAHDISVREEFEQRLRQQATTDLLTGLENRHAFNALIESLKDGVDPEAVSVFYLDLDKFKELNDRHGHGGGDAALVALGQRLTRLAIEEPGLRIFRIGGDEFCCILLRSASLKDVSGLARRIKNLASEPISYDSRLIDLTTSVGASTGERGEGIEYILELADAAVYDAKSQGGDACIVPEPHIRERLERRVSIHRDLMSAIARGEIGLHYQPIMRVSDCSLVGVEALARWTHPKYGAIDPAEFIEIAEASRHIIAFGEYVMRQACTDMLAWMTEFGQTVRLSVNVSPNELLSHGFVASVTRILEETQFPPNLLEIEITERGVLRNLDTSCEVIEAIRDLGVTIALDDFGTGNSSLSRLENLPVDRVKLDRSFFVRAEHSDRARQVLGILSGMSRVLDINVIAEGVETEEQFRFVNLAGFGEVQGYLFGRPAPISQLGEDLAAKVRADIPA